MKTVPEMLRDAAAIYEERNKLYGDNYKRFGPIMALLFPKGLIINDAVGWNRLGILVQMMAKCTRYAEQFCNGGHTDSLDDLAVYAMMLQELDSEALEVPPVAEERWSFDDHSIGRRKAGASSLSSREVNRPIGFRNDEWYEHAAKVCNAMNGSAG